MAALKTFSWLLWNFGVPLYVLVVGIDLLRNGDYVHGTNFALMGIGWFGMPSLKMLAKPSRWQVVAAFGGFWLVPLMLFGTVVWDKAGPFPLWQFYGSIAAIWSAINVPLIVMSYNNRNYVAPSK